MSLRTSAYQGLCLSEGKLSFWLSAVLVLALAVPLGRMRRQLLFKRHEHVFWIQIIRYVKRTHTLFRTWPLGQRRPSPPCPRRWGAGRCHILRGGIRRPGRWQFQGSKIKKDLLVNISLVLWYFIVYCDRLCMFLVCVRKWGIVFGLLFFGFMLLLWRFGAMVLRFGFLFSVGFDFFSLLLFLFLFVCLFVRFELWTCSFMLFQVGVGFQKVCPPFLFFGLLYRPGGWV